MRSFVLVGMALVFALALVPEALAQVSPFGAPGVPRPTVDAGGTGGAMPRAMLVVELLAGLALALLGLALLFGAMQAGS